MLHVVKSRDRRARGQLILGAVTAAWMFTSHTAWAVFDSAQVPTDSDLKVVRVLPEGDQVPAPGRQIVLTFDRPVTALGVMAVDAAHGAVNIVPSVACQWHWLDPRSLACELNESQALAPATRYTVTLAAGVRAQDGATLKAPYQWSFETERPAVKEYSFRTWRSPGMPVIRLVFDQPVTQDSAQSSLHFADQPGVVAAPDPYVREVFYVLPLPGEPGAVVFPSGTPPAKSDDRTVTTVNAAGRPVEARRVWLVSPQAELPIDTRVRLKVVPGLHSYAGPLPGTEHRTIVAFDTFPEFRFIGVRCLIGDQYPLIGVTTPTDAQPACNPFGRVSLAFSAPVIAAEIKAHLVLDPDLLNGRTDFDPWANDYPVSQLGSPHKRGALYVVTLPEHLRAFQPYSIATLRGVRDEFGRSLSGPTAMQFRTDHRPPRLKVTHPVSVLEKDAPTAMPLYVTNLTDIEINYRKLTSSGMSGDLSFRQPIDRVWDIAYATPAKVRDLLQGESGVVTGRLQADPTASTVEGYRYFDEAESDPGLASGRPDRDFFAEVTPFQVHVKLGAFNTVVWVTSLAKGTPVPNARVRVFRDNYQGLGAAAAVLSEAVTDRDGIAVVAGRQSLEHDANASATPDDTFMVRVDAGRDIALLPLDTSFAIDTYRASRGSFWSGYGVVQNHAHAWGTTAQGVYKLGDTVQYKVYLRDQNNLTLQPMAQRSGYQLDIVDPTGKVVKSEMGITLSDFGAYAGSFRVPPTGAVGWYEFNLKGPAASDASSGTVQAASWTPMRVLIADFPPAPFLVTNTLNGQSYQPGDRVEVATQASMHAGGPYASADSRVTARLFPQAVEISNPAAAGFEFASQAPRGPCSYEPGPDVLTINQTDANTGEKGEFASQFTVPDVDMLSARLEVESAVRDERGKYVANRVYAEFRARDRFVGMRSEAWTFEEGKPANIQYLVVDQNGKVAQGTEVTVAINGQTTSAARIKGAGDAYLTSFQSEWTTDGGCAATLSGEAPQTCTFTPSHPGLYSIAATIKDTKGRPHTTEMCRWVTGKGRVLWEEPADMSLSIIPEKPTYKVGEHARYLVKNPFPGATALITVERLGVIKRWVQVLGGNTPIIDFKVEPDFVPGYYLSVVVVSPRVAPVPGAALLDKDGVDLGRPTYRIGYLKVPVSDPVKNLDVQIKSDRPSYKPRDIVTLKLHVKPHSPEASKEPVEFAVTVLDEAVFDLIQDGKKYFDPYRGMYQLDNLDLSNYSLLTRLIGLQKFEKKGANSGGDGGAGFDMRSISKYVAYWNPSVMADKRGNAAVSFPLPDNLTGWRVFAIAVTPADRVGLGDYKFKSSKLTELRPVLPNQLTVQDRFIAGFSVLNRADKTRTIDVDLEARGPIEAGSTRIHQSITLGAFKRETVWLPVVTTGDGTVKLTATAADALDKDALSQDLAVHKRVSLDVAASYGTTTTSAIDEAVHFPDMLPNVGDISVTLTPSVLGNVDGAMRYIRDYPYLCWEQRLTKALMAANYIRLRGYLAADLDWAEAKSLPQQMLDDAASFQAPNGGMGFWTSDEARVSPYLSADTALAFNRLRAAGYRPPEDVEKALDAYLEALLRSNTAPTFYSEGMVSSVRAVALQALAERGRASLADLQRYEKYLPQMDLFGLAAYLEASLKIKGADSLARSVAGRILAHANESGGQFQFSEVWDDGYYQMLGTPLRSNCAILSAFLHYGEAPQGAALVGDVPFKLMRAIKETRGSRDHWENTQENVFCTSALSDYAGLYEKDVPAFSATASLDGTPMGKAQFNAFRDPPAVVSRPNTAADIGRQATLHIAREGTGRLYYATRLSYAPTDRAAKETNAGIEVHREYSVQRNGEWQLLGSPVAVKRGELVRVDLYLSIPAPRHFVVVDDPVPGGLEPVNRDLATASTVDADQTEFRAAGGAFWFKYSDWSEYGVALWSFYHRELKHDAARFYADYLPAGNYHLSYGAQAMAEGEFSASPAKAEQMYDPDVYGKSLPAHVSVAHE